MCHSYTLDSTEVKQVFYSCHKDLVLPMKATGISTMHQEEVKGDELISMYNICFCAVMEFSTCPNRRGFNFTLTPNMYTLVDLYNRRMYPSCVLTSLNSPRVDPGRESPNSNKVAILNLNAYLSNFLGINFSFIFNMVFHCAVMASFSCLVLGGYLKTNSD